MKALILSALTVLAFQANAAVTYSDKAVVPTSATNFKLVSAQYDLVPTRTEIRHIPGCNPNGEASTTCTEEVTVESQEVIRVDVSYQDRNLTSEGNELQWATLVFKTADFSASDVALLKSVYPGWKHPFSRVATKYARDNFNLSVTKVKNTIRVVDMKKSKICYPYGESGEIPPGCVEKLVYKNAESPALLVTVTRK